MTTSAKDPSPVIEVQHEEQLRTLPFGDRDDFEAADRGLLGSLSPAAITTSSGAPVWDNDSYAFLLDGEAPTSVNPSLWRQSSLLARQGLYEVGEGIYQVRGFDLSVVSFLEGGAGVIVVDPLISTEAAAAALALYRQHRGPRPVTGVIYTHSHIDHFGGVKGVTSQEEVDAGAVAILAPEGFLHHAIEENVYAGTAMGRRAGYMYGAALDRGPRGQVGAGLGQTTSTGTPTLIPPTLTITETGQTETVDGVELEFQVTPGTEAPAEMNFFLPATAALCMAENASRTLHNLLTLRGAPVRDPHAWAMYLTEAIDLFGDRLEVVFASHHWPTWGREKAVGYLSLQRDVYAYLHDQTLRMLNRGMKGVEIAEAIRLPPALEGAWHTRGYYGSVSHNVKAIYQRYMGWYDGNPASLWPHPPAEAGRRYLEFMGGADAVVEKARACFEEGDFRWVAEVVNHVLQTEPDHAAARELLADTYEQLGYGAENGTWRSVYLSGAHELRHGVFGTPAVAASADLLSHLAPDQVLDAMAIRVDGPSCWEDDLVLDFTVAGHGTYRVTLHNGVLVYTTATQSSPAATTVTLTPQLLAGLAFKMVQVAGLADAGGGIEGDAAQLDRLLEVLQDPDPDFAILTPAGSQ